MTSAVYLFHLQYALSRLIWITKMVCLFFSTSLNVISVVCWWTNVGVWNRTPRDRLTVIVSVFFHFYLLNNCVIHHERDFHSCKCKSELNIIQIAASSQVDMNLQLFRTLVRMALYSLFAMRGTSRLCLLFVVNTAYTFKTYLHYSSERKRWL
jgi:hypothetical protein